jgi:hypothetical protein
MSRPLSIVAIQTSPVTWDPEATWTAFEADLRARRAHGDRDRAGRHDPGEVPKDLPVATTAPPA